MMMNTTFKKTVLASSITALVIGLAACGGGGGGGSSSTDKGSSNVQMSGAVVDDYVAFARIYVDVDNNGQFDPAYEPYAYTDADGYFSKSKTDAEGNVTNYCALDPREYASRYCFKADSAVKNGGVIRVESGRDLLTTQVYNAAMSLLMDGSTTDGLTVSSLTSSVESMNNDELVQAAVDGLNLTEEQVEQVQTEYADYLTDYLTTSSTASAKNTARSTPSFNLNAYNPLDLEGTVVDKKERGFKLAVQLHKIAEALADGLLPTSTPSGEEDLQRSDLLPSVYFALIYNLIQNNSSSNDDLFKSPNFMSSVITNARALLIARFGSNYTFPIPSSSNMENLAKYTNCVLSDENDTAISSTALETDYGSGNNCSNILATSGDTIDEKMYAAELGTDVITDGVTSGSQSGSFDQALEAALATFDAIDNDFSTSSINVRNGSNPRAQVQEFPTDSLSENYLDFVDDDNPSESIQVNFADDGSVQICQADNSGNPTLFEGKWRQDPVKDHIIYIEYLNIPITIKNLEPSQTGCDVTGGTCMVVEYPDLENPGEVSTVTTTSSSSISESSDIAKPKDDFSCGNS